jgi:hypothetical protein
MKFVVAVPPVQGPTVIRRVEFEFGNVRLCKVAYALEMRPSLDKQSSVAAEAEEQTGFVSDMSRNPFITEL